MRGNRRRANWKALSPWLESTHVRPGTPFLLAPVNHVADIIDACSGVKFINYMTGSFNGDPPASRLTAHRVFTYKEPGKWRATTFIAFTSKSGFLPSVFNGLSVYSIHGSEYTFTVVKDLPQERHNVVDVTLNGVASEAEALRRAVVTSSEFINEEINPMSEPFNDAVLSRYNFFVRQRMTPTASRQCSESSESVQSVGSPMQPRITAQPPLPPGPPPYPPPGRLKAESFHKPDFESIEDLMFAFSTHVIDTSTGLGRALSPLELMTDRSKYQPLVFCSPQPITVQCVEVD